MTTTVTPMSNSLAVEVDVDDAPPPMGTAVERQDDDDDASDTAAATIGPPKRKEKPDKVDKAERVAGAVDTTPFKEQRVAEDRLTKEWLDSLNAGGLIKVAVERRYPKMWKGKNVGGTVGTYDEFIDEEFIRDHHGGGTYQVTVRKQNPKGTGFVYAGGKSVSIAGDPRVDDVYRDGDGLTGVQAQVQAQAQATDRAMTTMEKLLAQAQAQGGRGPDASMMKLILEPMQAQLDAMNRALEAKDRQLAERARPVEPPKDEFREKFMSTLLDADNSRITSLRTQHESEVRQIKQSSIDTEQRLRDGFERDKASLERAHERELSSLKSAADMRVLAMQESHAMSVKMQDNEIRRLERDLTEARTELATLRLRKDKSIVEQAKEFAAIKEAIGDATGEDKEEKSGWATAAEVVTSLPAVQGLMAKMAGGGEAPQQQAQRPPPRPVRNLTGPDGNLYVQFSDGSQQLAATAAQRRHHQAQQAKQQAAARANGQAAPLPELAPETVKIAVSYLDNAFRGNQDPEQVATSVRSMIPADVMAVIKERGIEGFLEAAKLDTTSQLASQAGRNWIRKVGKALVGG